jgi:hypothetical protein
VATIERAKQLLAQNGISLPSDQLDVYTIRSFLGDVLSHLAGVMASDYRHSRLGNGIAEQMHQQLASMTPFESLSPPSDQEALASLLRGALNSMGLLNSSAGLSPVSQQQSHSRFNGRDHIYGKADSLERFMCISDITVYRGNIAKGKMAIVEEFEKKGTEDDKECLDYVLNRLAGDNMMPDGRVKAFPNGIRDCDAVGNVLPDRQGMRFENFVAIGSRLGVDECHVLALRLYTTWAYRSLNDSLRDESRWPLTRLMLTTC